MSGSILSVLPPLNSKPDKLSVGYYKLFSVSFLISYTHKLIILHVRQMSILYFSSENIHLLMITTNKKELLRETS